MHTTSSDPRISFSCIEHDLVWPGEGNIEEDPLFLQPGHWDDNGCPFFPEDAVWIEGDYHLQDASPCIDTGMLAGGPTTDIEGNGRPCGAGVDIGAYEMGECPPDDSRFLRGDSNSDGNLDVADPVYTLLYIFRDGKTPSCLDTADANDDGAIDVADAVYVLQFLFVEGPVIPPPYPECGIDPTVDELGCLDYPGCQ